MFVYALMVCKLALFYYGAWTTNNNYGGANNCRNIYMTFCSNHDILWGVHQNFTMSEQIE